MIVDVKTNNCNMSTANGKTSHKAARIFKNENLMEYMHLLILSVICRSILATADSG
jgi:hypothetical protein